MSTTQSGTAHITASSDLATSAPISVTFAPGPPDILWLSPATQVISAGNRITYTAIATDVYGNLVGDVTANTTFATAPGAGVTISGNAITPTLKGAYTVTGTHTNGVSGTAALSVTPADYTRLAIERPLGTEVVTDTLTIYETHSYNVAPYDQFGNYIDPPSASWFGTGVIAGHLSPLTGAATTFTPVVSGTGVITAAFGGITDTTGAITVQAPNLVITKFDSPDPVSAGGSLAYTLIYTNVGDAPTQGIVITDTYDPNTTFVGSVPAPNIPGATQTVWTTEAGNLAPNESKLIQVFTIVARSLPVSTVLTNTVRISGPELMENGDTETTQVTVTPTLEISKIQEAPAGSSVRVSDTIAYRLIYTNVGSALLHNIVITETYDPKVKYGSAFPRPDFGTNNRWTIPSLGAGLTGNIFVNVIVKAPQTDGASLINTVSIDSDETAPHTVPIPPISIQAPILSLSHRVAPSPVQANAPLTYTLSYTNSGSTYASSSVITTLLPSEVVFVSAQPPYSQIAGNLLTWELGPVDSHTTGRITVSVRVNNNLDNGTMITAVSRIRAAEIVSASAQVSTVVNSAPNVMLTASDGLASAAAGQTLTYTLVYTNAGNARAQGVVITDQIPSNVDLQSCSGCTGSSGLYTFILGTVDAGAGGVETVRVQVNSPLPAGLRSITNTAGIRTTTPGDSPSDNQAQDVDVISTVPMLAIRASFDALTPYPTKVVTYSIRYTNTSDMHTTGVVVSATKSASVTYTSTRSSAWITAGGLVYTYPVGNLAARASGLLTFVVSLPDALEYITGTTGFTNVFAIRDNGPGGLPVATSVNTTLLGVPDLVIDRVTTPATIRFNQPFTALVVIRNMGTGRACNPDNPPGCGGFWLDTFIDPIIPPPSFPFTVPGQTAGYGRSVLTAVPTLNPGASVTVPVTNIIVTPAQDLILYFKVDNFACHIDASCSPDGAQHGLVPEGNEYNNVIGPVQFRIYLPAIYTQYKPP